MEIQPVNQCRYMTPVNRFYPRRTTPKILVHDPKQVYPGAFRLRKTTSFPFLVSIPAAGINCNDRVLIDNEQY